MDTRTHAMQVGVNVNTAAPQLAAHTHTHEAELLVVARLHAPSFRMAKLFELGVMATALVTALAGIDTVTVSEAETA